MPRSLTSLPLSGLFGIIKPSGPTSMHVVDQLKRLICNSRLFVDQEKIKKPPGKKRGRNNVKIGQGGTLDPLADGVLGQLNLVGNSWYCALNNSAVQWSVLGKARRN
jgi:tRNA pseudouridine55 synthase